MTTLKLAPILIILMTIVGCYLNESQDEIITATSLHENKSDQLEKSINTYIDVKFLIKLENITLNARLDNYNQITVLDYPSDWTAKIYLEKFDKNENFHFSKNQCEEVRTLIKNGKDSLARIGYHASLIFEIPPYLSDNFYNQVAKAATLAGINRSWFEITNLPSHLTARAEISWQENAISKLSNSKPAIESQLNIGRKGYEISDFKKNLVVNGGDILCDLMSGEAKLVMVYPVGKENKEIKVTYKPVIFN